MSTQLPMTLQDIQDRIHRLASSDASTPTADDDLWLVRLDNINMAVANWERQDVFWKELIVTYSGSTIAATVTAYALNADDFRILGSLVRLVLTDGSIKTVDVIRPEDRLKYSNYSGDFCYLTGNVSDGYTLVFGWAPAVGDPIVGATIQFEYLKSADRLKKAADVPVMSDPDFIVYWVAGQELLFNGRTNLAQNYLGEADDALRRMKVQNEMVPHYASNALQDVESMRDNGDFGL